MVEAGNKPPSLFWTKSHTFPAWPAWDQTWAILRSLGLVYLTWTTPFVSAGIHKSGWGSSLTNAFPRKGTDLRCLHTRRHQTVSLLYLSKRCQSRPIGRQNTQQCFTVKLETGVEFGGA